MDAFFGIVPAMLTFLQEMVLEAGRQALRYRERLSSIAVESKDGRDNDLVTEADREIERCCRERIARTYPEHAVLGEEQGTTAGNEYRWIIDPIDGTLSFFRGQPFYSISIALAKRDRVIAGAVYAPQLDELFLAERDQGATLNGEPVRVSEVAKLEASVMATGFACIRAGSARTNIPVFTRVVPRIRGVRRFGSAALDLCYVACGRLDGFWELDLQLYDIAAGQLIVEEAGGRVSDWRDGVDGLPGEVAATNGALHAQLLTAIHDG